MENLNKTELKALEKKAKKDNEACLLLARMYFEGNGVVKDYKLGLKYACQAAKLGNNQAYNFIGFAYANGYGTKVDYKQAAKAYEKGSINDDGLAEFSLSVLIKNKVLGKKYVKKLDENLEAAKTKNNVYIMYDEAVRLMADYKEIIDNENIGKAEMAEAETYRKQAIRLLKDSSNGGCEDAILALAVLYLKGDGIAQSSEKAKELIDKLDEKKCPLINYIYGYMYDTGIGYEQNYEKAYECYLKMYKYYEARKELDTPEADDVKLALAIGLYTGLGVKEDKQKAYSVFEPLAQKDNIVACYYAAKYLESLPIPDKASSDKKAAKKQAKDKNYQDLKQKADKCFKYYQKASDGGIVNAEMGLARCYKDGRGVDVNENLAFDLIESATSKENPEAMYYYALALMNGEYGLDVNVGSANEFMRKSANAGNLLAIQYRAANSKELNDEEKEFADRLFRAAQGDSTLYYNLAREYALGKGFVEKSGCDAAYWYAKTALESPVKKEREKAANLLVKFDKDLNGHWDFKEVVAKTNKDLNKQIKEEAKAAAKQAKIDAKAAKKNKK